MRKRGACGYRVKGGGLHGRHLRHVNNVFVVLVVGSGVHAAVRECPRCPVRVATGVAAGQTMVGFERAENRLSFSSSSSRRGLLLKMWIVLQMLPRYESCAREVWRRLRLMTPCTCPCLSRNSVAISYNTRLRTMRLCIVSFP
jgi:hypothetical protein